MIASETASSSSSSLSLSSHTLQICEQHHTAILDIPHKHLELRTSSLSRESHRHDQVSRILHQFVYRPRQFYTQAPSLHLCDLIRDHALAHPMTTEFLYLCYQRTRTRTYSIISSIAIVISSCTCTRTHTHTQISPSPPRCSTQIEIQNSYFLFFFTYFLRKSENLNYAPGGKGLLQTVVTL